LKLMRIKAVVSFTVVNGKEFCICCSLEQSPSFGICQYHAYVQYLISHPCPGEQPINCTPPMKHTRPQPCTMNSKKSTPTPHALMIIDASMECGTPNNKNAYVSNPAYTHNCLITLCSLGCFISSIPSNVSFAGNPEMGIFDFGSSGSLHFSLRRRSIEIPPRVTLSKPSSSTPFGTGCALWWELCGDVSRHNARIRRERFCEKPSSEVSQDFAKPVSKPGAKFERISAANIPCIKNGFRASTTGIKLPGLEYLSSGIGEMARANVRVSRSKGGDDAMSEAKMVL